MNILDNIIEYKKSEVLAARQKYPIEKLILDAKSAPLRPSFINSIQDPLKNGIIAEFKRKSPSKGIINSQADISDVCIKYQAANVSAISVLADSNFFGGKHSDVIKASDIVSIPVLRKDFIVDEYQIYESKTIGASAILLIAKVLSPEELNQFYKLATYLNLDVLFEVHDKDDINKLPADAKLVGINNRNLKTFKVDFENSIKLAEHLNPNAIKIAESGISDSANIILLKKYGFKGFLIGENFMSQQDPGDACQKFCSHL